MKRTLIFTLLSVTSLGAHQQSRLEKQRKIAKGATIASGLGFAAFTAYAAQRTRKGLALATRHKAYMAFTGAAALLGAYAWHRAVKKLDVRHVPPLYPEEVEELKRQKQEREAHAQALQQKCAELQALKNEAHKVVAQAVDSDVTEALLEKLQAYRDSIQPLVEQWSNEEAAEKHKDIQQLYKDIDILLETVGKKDRELGDQEDEKIIGDIFQALKALHGTAQEPKIPSQAELQQWFDAKKGLKAVLGVYESLEDLGKIRRLHKKLYGLLENIKSHKFKIPWDTLNCEDLIHRLSQKPQDPEQGGGA